MAAMAELVRRGLTRWSASATSTWSQMRRAQAALGDCRSPATRCSTTCGTGRSRRTSCRTARKQRGGGGLRRCARGGYMRGTPSPRSPPPRRTPRQVALNFLTRRPSLFTIPKASGVARAGERGGAGLHADARGGPGDRWRDLREASPRRRRPARRAEWPIADPAAGHAGRRGHGPRTRHGAPEAARPPRGWARVAGAGGGRSGGGAPLDAADPLARFRREFVVRDARLIYLDGNSLGRLPRRAAPRLREAIEREWGGRLIRGWGEGWFTASQRIGAKLAAADRSAARTTSSSRTPRRSTCSSWWWRRSGRDPAAAPWSPTS